MASPPPDPKAPAPGPEPPLALLGATVVLVVLMGLALRARDDERERVRQEQRAIAHEQLGQLQRSLSAELQTAQAELASLADWWALHPDGNPEEFDRVSARLLKRHRALRSTTLLPDDVIRHTYPDNPGLLGLDVGGHPVQGRAVADMRARRAPIVTGPITLEQGGRGLILRRPVLAADDDRYLGHVSLVFDVQGLAALVRSHAELRGVLLQLTDAGRSGHTAELRLPPDVRFDAAATLTTMDFDVAQERWQLRAAPLRTTPKRDSPWFYFIGGFAVLASIGVYQLLSSRASLRASNRALAASEAAARRSAEAKASFVATVSHELRTPLNGMIATAELLGESQLDTAQRELVGVLTGSGRGLLALINDVLDFSKLEAQKMVLDPQPTSVRTLAMELRALLLHEAQRKGITLHVDVAESVPEYVQVDSSRLRQVLLNLLTNALKFTERGEVRLLIGSAGESKIRCEVRDQGIGIEDPSVLFQPFIQADAGMSRKYGGTGLGLSICRRLVELMGGDIDVTSTLGQGSSFFFEVPAPRVSAPESMLPGAAAAIPAAGRALVADDNRVNLLVARRVLQRFGWQVDLAADGQEAITAAAEGSYDLIFMDCQMPEMDGFEATTRLRAQGCLVPIIAMTANAESEVRERCAAVGMSDHLSKPVDLESMRRMLDRGHGQRGAVAVQADAAGQHPAS